MNHQPFFSIVMPVYGVEKYLTETVQSVLQQTEPDFELILVDDCSKDNSGVICDELSKKDSRISVLHLPQNGGLSNARNQGFQKVNGQYVFFMDSDDTIQSSLLHDVKNALEKNPAEVTVFGIHEEYFNKKDELSRTNDIVWDGQEYYEDATSLRPVVIELEKKTLYGYAWNKIYNVEYLKQQDAKFKQVTLIEDILFNVEVFHNIQKLNVLKIAPYNYKKRQNGSLTNKFVIDYFDLHRQRVQMIYDQYFSWNLCTEDVEQALANIYARYIVSALQRNCDKRANMSHKDRKIFLQNLYLDALWIELSPHLTLDHSLQGILSTFLKKKQTALCLLAARFIFFVKNKLPMLFVKLK